MTIRHGIPPAALVEYARQQLADQLDAVTVLAGGGVISEREAQRREHMAKSVFATLEAAVRMGVTSGLVAAPAAAPAPPPPCVEGPPDRLVVMMICGSAVTRLDFDGADALAAGTSTRNRVLDRIEANLIDIVKRGRV